MKSTGALYAVTSAIIPQLNYGEGSDSDLRLSSPTMREALLTVAAFLQCLATTQGWVCVRARFLNLRVCTSPTSFIRNPPTSHPPLCRHKLSYFRIEISIVAKHSRIDICRSHFVDYRGNHSSCCQKVP